MYNNRACFACGDVSWFVVNFWMHKRLNDLVVAHKRNF